jgi:hypothetical protein
VTEWLVAPHEVTTSTLLTHSEPSASPESSGSGVRGLRLTSFEVDGSLVTSPVPPIGDG